VTPEKEPHKMEPAEKIRPVLRELDEFYGRKTREHDPDPLDVLVRGVLSQNTSDVNSGRAWESLMEAFGDWDSMADASHEEIADAIRSGGLADQKTETIQSILEWLGEGGHYSLDFLEDMDSAEAEKLLKSIKGVGVKTARLVLLFGLDRPVFVVDTHVHRVSRRLGLIPPKADRRKAHLLLDELVPDEDKYSGHLNLIQHGRQTCRSQSPLCDECPVRRCCLYVRGEVE
jgi:endonuclease-3